MLRSVLRHGHALARRARLLAMSPGETFRPVPGGLFMRLDPRDPYDADMLLGDWEPYLALCIEAAVRPGEFCVDVGTHKGFFTLMLARLVGEAGAVLAVDPDPRAFALLRENLSYNRIKHVHARQLALADGPGTIELALSRQLGWSSRFPNELAAPTVVETISVEAASLDDLLAREALPPAGRTFSFVKIDAEGSEPQILAGMDRAVRRHRPILHLEANLGSLRAAGPGPEGIAGPLRRWGYTAFEVTGRRDLHGRRRLRLVEVDPAALDRSVDLVCAHPASPLIERLIPAIAR